MGSLRQAEPKYVPNLRHIDEDDYVLTLKDSIKFECNDEEMEIKLNQGRIGKVVFDTDAATLYRHEMFKISYASGEETEPMTVETVRNREVFMQLGKEASKAAADGKMTQLEDVTSPEALYSTLRALGLNYTTKESQTLEGLADVLKFHTKHHDTGKVSQAQIDILKKRGAVEITLQDGPWNQAAKPAVDGSVYYDEELHADWTRTYHGTNIAYLRSLLVSGFRYELFGQNFCYGEGNYSAAL